MNKKQTPYILDCSLSAKENEHLVSLFKRWILRVLVPLGGHKEFIQEHYFNDDSIAQLFSFEENEKINISTNYKKKFSNGESKKNIFEMTIKKSC